MRRSIYIALCLVAALLSKLGVAQGHVADETCGTVTFRTTLYGCYSTPPSSASDTLIPLFAEIDKAMNAKHFADQQLGERIVSAGKLLLGKPYLDKTLEVGTDLSHAVCNLTGFDCVTLFENAWALARLAKTRKPHSISAFESQLLLTRYRDGEANGFQSRLHYTTDYFYNNTQRGLLKEMTRTIGKKYAILETKPINFMTKHPNLYKQLKDDPAMVAKMDSIEHMINARGGFYYIKKENVEKIESGIQDGDLIGITTSIPGIDISHTGIAVKGDDGRIHFMNASSVFHKVIISKEPLADYLANNSKQTGIIVYRPIEQP